MELVKFEDGTSLEFAPGKFDNYCVFYLETSGSRTPPLDIDYFSTILELALDIGHEMIYFDFVEVYVRTTRDVDNEVFVDIRERSRKYGANASKYEKVMGILYATMIAEENKVNTKLGKRIKRLGIHTILLENLSVADAADFMRGMKWREISSLCESRGF